MGFLVSPMMSLFSKVTVLLLFVLWCASFTSTGWQSFSLFFFFFFCLLEAGLFELLMGCSSFNFFFTKWKLLGVWFINWSGIWESLFLEFDE